MSKQTQAVTVGFPLPSILTVIFVIAKLTGAVTWSWLWVFSPIWISLLSVLSVAVLSFIVITIVAIFAALLG